MPEFSEPSELVDWLGENLPERGWEALKEELAELPGNESLVAWLESMSEDERQGYLGEPAGREQVVAWLRGEPPPEADEGADAAGPGAAAEPAVGLGAEPAAALEPAAAEPAASGPGEPTWDEARQEWLFYDATRGWLRADGSPLEAPAAAEPEPAGAFGATEPEPAGAFGATEPAGAFGATEPAGAFGAAEPATAGEPEPATAASPEGAGAPADAAEPEPAAEPELPELPETTQSYVDEAVDEELAPVFDEAFASVEGLDQLSPEDLREVLAEALAESGLSE